MSAGWVGIQCYVECCTRDVRDNWLCNRHHSMLFRTGSVFAEPKIFNSIEERLEKFGKRDENGCLVWQRCINDSGYGKLTYKRKQHRVHRLAYELYAGEIPKGMMVDHECHNRACYEITHLRLATPKQNAENHGTLLRNNTSGYRGVTFDKATGKWLAQMWDNWVKYSSGGHLTAESAHEWVLAKRLELYTHNTVDRKLACTS